MGQPAAVMNDAIVGTCAIHQIPNPASGAPQPGPPMPFQAPVTIGCATSVFINNKAAVVQGASGVNQSVHVGLHPADPYFAPPTQQGNVVMGSATVLIENKSAIRTGDQVTMCASVPGQIVGSASTVLIGG